MTDPIKIVPGMSYSSTHRKSNEYHRYKQTLLYNSLSPFDSDRKVTCEAFQRVQFAESFKDKKGKEYSIIKGYDDSNALTYMAEEPGFVFSRTIDKKDQNDINTHHFPDIEFNQISTNTHFAYDMNSDGIVQANEIHPWSELDNQNKIIEQKKQSNK